VRDTHAPIAQLTPFPQIQVMQQLVFAGLTREPVATAIALGDSDNVTSEGVGGGGGGGGGE